MRPSARYLASLVACMAAMAAGAAAQTAQDPPLVVATKETPPFVIRSGEAWTGLSIELWERIAAELGIRYRYQAMELAEMLEGTAAREVDVAVAALTVTADRERRVDFTNAFLAAGLGMATRARDSNLLGALAGRVFSRQFLEAVLALALVLMVCGALVWTFERRANPDQFGGPGLRGLGAGFWFSAVTMTTVGYGDKAPRTIGGRAVALVWMFASIIIISGYTAAIASALTVEGMTGSVQGPEDLPGARIGSVSGSAATDWLQDRGLFYRDYPAPADAVAGLAADDIDVVVYDLPILSHLLKSEPGLIVLPHVLRREQYAFALPTGSPLRDRLNQQLLEVLESDSWDRLVDQYLGR